VLLVLEGGYGEQGPDLGVLDEAEHALHDDVVLHVELLGVVCGAGEVEVEDERPQGRDGVGVGRVLGSDEVVTELHDFWDGDEARSELVRGPRCL